MPTEMIKLREALDNLGIQWDDDTTDRKDGFPFIDMSVYRTKVHHNGRRYLVIGGVGVFGTELLVVKIDNAEPIDGLTAIDVLDIIED